MTFDRDLPRVLSRADLISRGYTRAALRHAVARGRWRSLIPGVIATFTGPPSRADWARAGVLIAAPGSAVSGWDAARAYGVGERRPPTSEVLILAPGGRHRTVGPIRIRPTRRRFRAWPMRLVESELPPLVVAHAARAIADTALEYRWRDPVRALVTSAIQRGLCSPDDLLAELDAGPQNGSAFLRQALDDVAVGARSIAEAEAVDHLRAATVPDFELNVPIIDADGATIAVADVLWRDLRAIAEVDSREFHFSETDWKATSRRHNDLTSRGFAVQHYPPSEIRSDGVLWSERVETWLRGRARELGVDYRPGDGPVAPGPDGPRPFLLL